MRKKDNPFYYCQQCKKPLKEDTEGNNKYCQGHSIFNKSPK